jgi:hypothetical protein
LAVERIDHSQRDRDQSSRASMGPQNMICGEQTSGTCTLGILVYAIDRVEVYK